MRFVLAHPLILQLGCAALVAASFFCYRALGRDLLPAMDEGGFILDYLMPAGSSLDDTNKVLLGVEKILAATPEVESTSRRTGLQLGLAAVTEANQGDFSVRLKRDAQPRHRRDHLRCAREGQGQISAAGCRVHSDASGHDRRFDRFARADGDQAVFAQDPNLLKEWAPKVADKVKKIKGVVDVEDGIENTISGPAIVMNVDPVIAARAGFTPEEVELDASAILQGEPATTPVVVNDRAYTIRVRFPEDTRGNLEEIRNTVITSSSSGKTATLGSLAEFKDEAGQTEIIRENLQRRVAVTGRFEGMSLGTGMEAVQQAVAGDGSPAGDPGSVRRPLCGAAEIVQGSGGGAGAGGGAGVHGAADRVPHVLRARGDSGFGAALDLRRVRRAAGDRDLLQHLLLHGTDHGHRNRGEERNSAAGRRPEIPVRRDGARAKP